MDVPNFGIDPIYNLANVEKLKKPIYFNSKGEKLIKRFYGTQKHKILNTLHKMGEGWHSVISVTCEMHGIPRPHRRYIDEDSRFNSTDDSVRRLGIEGLITREPTVIKHGLEICGIGFNISAEGIEAITDAKGYKAWLKNNRYALRGKRYAGNDIKMVKQ